MGDPETEVVIPRIKNDLVEVFKAVADKTLDKVELEIDDRAATTVIAVSGGYPEAYEKGKEILGLESIDNSIVFHAGTKKMEDKVISNGGRVLAMTSFGKDHEEGLALSYSNLKNCVLMGCTTAGISGLTCKNPQEPETLIVRSLSLAELW